MNYKFELNLRHFLLNILLHLLHFQRVVGHYDDIKSNLSKLIDGGLAEAASPSRHQRPRILAIPLCAAFYAKEIAVIHLNIPLAPQA